MTSPAYDFDRLESLLCKSAGDPDVVALTGVPAEQVERSADRGYIELSQQGISVMFKIAGWLVPKNQIEDPQALHVSAFHLHRQGHEGYEQCSRPLPNGVAIGVSKTDVVAKMGAPTVTGGGGMNTILKRPNPHWLRYTLDEGAQLQRRRPGRRRG